MSRFARAPLLVQVLGLVLAVAVAAQITSITAVIVMPSPREPFTFADVASALRTGRPVQRRDLQLIVSTMESPPERWDLDDNDERRSRATLAALLGLPYERVRVETDIPIPGGDTLVRIGSPAVAVSASPPRPYARGAEVTFYDKVAAAQRTDGSWVVVRTPTFWGAAITFLLVWLAAGLLVLLPLAWAFTRRLVRPIREFAETAERAGRGDREARFVATGPKEVRRAAGALDEMQRRITGAVEERTNLIAAIAHDLRTPLARLRFRVEEVPLCQRDAIVRDIERMDSMIAGVLAFARGEGRAVRERVDLFALVQSLVDDLAEGGANVRVLEASPLQVEGDPLALRRLVGNLLDNAVKYGGGAACRVLARQDKAFLLVEDEGGGVPDDELEHLFTPFVRGGSARDPATGGVGLGLAIARAIARSHGGEVWLERRSEGGLCANVELPLAVGAGSATH